MGCACTSQKFQAKLPFAFWQRPDSMPGVLCCSPVNTNLHSCLDQIHIIDFITKALPDAYFLPVWYVEKLKLEIFFFYFTAVKAPHRHMDTACAITPWRNLNT